MKRFKHLNIILPLTALALAIYAAMDYFGYECFYRRRFDIFCPGCGIARAFKALLSLDIAGAFHYNAMFWAVPILYLYILTNGNLIGKKKIDNAIIFSLLGGMVVNCIVVNLIYKGII